MNWYEMKQQRRKNRGEGGSFQRAEFRLGHRRRKSDITLCDKKTGEVVATVKNGCFGNLAGINRDLYDAYAQGTQGAL